MINELGESPSPPDAAFVHHELQHDNSRATGVILEASVVRPKDLEVGIATPCLHLPVMLRSPTANSSMTGATLPHRHDHGFGAIGFVPEDNRHFAADNHFC
jgi:hypothetical protein